MDNFNKFKKKMLIEAIIKSIVISCSIGTIGFAVPYLIFFFSIFNFPLFRQSQSHR